MTDAGPALNETQPATSSAISPAGDGRLRSTWPIHARQVGQLLGCYAAIVGVWIGFGLLLTGPLEDSALTRADQRIARWFVEVRTPTWDTLSLLGSTLAETWLKTLLTLVIAVVMLKVWRRWLEPLVVAVALIVEAAAFLAITLVVGRERPDVLRLDESPIGSSFPSGHVAAAVAYAAIAVVVFWHTRNRAWRGLAIVVCATVPIVVGVSRMYRGMHFLSDVVAGVALGAAAVVFTVVILGRSRQARPLSDDSGGRSVG